jgi:chemotaxis protein MotB
MSKAKSKEDIILPKAPEAASEDVIEEGAPSWMTTFADLMSLLLTFFVLLYSMSELKVDNFFVAAQSLRSAMGSTAEVPPDPPIGLMLQNADPEIVLKQQGAQADDGEGVEDEIARLAEEYLDLLAAQLRAAADSAGVAEDLIEIVREEDGLYLRIRNAALFESAQVQVLPSAESLLVTIAGITADLAIPTIVSGHADSRPIGTSVFPSNWELSAARAAGVARLLSVSGHPPQMLEVQSYGEHRPLTSNDSEEGRAENRRVELFFSREYVEKLGRELASQGLPVVFEKDNGSAPPPAV